MQTNATDRQNADAQPRHERLLTTARGLLGDAEADAPVIDYCVSVLSSTTTYQRSRAQASLDATSAMLALRESDIDTKRTREAQKLLIDVAGGCDAYV